PVSSVGDGSLCGRSGGSDLVAVLETARCVAVALSPITPTLSRNIYMQLGFTAEQFSAMQWVRSKLHTVH
ncbi:unnamed protein product, partial [Closterium sp. NIES-65]